MDSFWIKYLVVSSVLTASSMLQCAVGFGAGLLAMPVLLFAGWSLPEAISILLVAGIIQNFLGAYRLRDAFDWQAHLRPNLFRLMFVPIGSGLLYWLQEIVPTSVVKQIVGGIILLFLAMIAGGKLKPREHLSKAWESIAMATSGLMLGFCGMGGPPIVMWITTQGWSARKNTCLHVSCFFAYNVTNRVDTLFTIWQRYSLCCRLFTPSLTLALFRRNDWLQKLVTAMHDQRLRRVTMVLLFGVAVSAILGPQL